MRGRADRRVGGSGFLPLLGAALLLSTGGGAAPAWSVTITLQSWVECSTAERAARCRVELENRGDEAAQDLQIELALDGGRAVASGIEFLAPGERGVALAELELPPGEGRHPVIVRLGYRDQNGYPLSALAQAQVETGSGDPPAVEGVLEPVSLAGPRKLRWRLTNREPEAVHLTATLLLPRELDSADAPRRLQLAPDQSVEGSHLISVSTGLTGSVYRVYLLVEYELDGRGQSLFLPADVRVVAARHRAGLYRREVLLWVALLAAAGTVAQVFARWRRPAPPTVWSWR